MTDPVTTAILASAKKQALEQALIDAAQHGPEYVLAITLRGRMFGADPRLIVQQASEMLQVLAMMGFYVMTPAQIQQLIIQAMEQNGATESDSTSVDPTEQPADRDEPGSEERVDGRAAPVLPLEGRGPAVGDDDPADGGAPVRPAPVDDRSGH